MNMWEKIALGALAATAAVGTGGLSTVGQAMLGAGAAAGANRALTPNTKITGPSPAIPDQQGGGFDLTKLLSQAQQPQQSGMNKLQLDRPF